MLCIFVGFASSETIATTNHESQEDLGQMDEPEEISVHLSSFYTSFREPFKISSGFCCVQLRFLMAENPSSL